MKTMKEQDAKRWKCVEVVLVAVLIALAVAAVLVINEVGLAALTFVTVL